MNSNFNFRQMLLKKFTTVYNRKSNDSISNEFDELSRTINAILSPYSPSYVNSSTEMIC